MKKFIFTISAVLVLNLLFAQTADLHQYYNKISKDNFYTTNFQELGKGNYPWEYKGILCKVFTNSGSGLLPVYRYSHSYAGHFYTINFDELKSGIDGWTYEGIGFYINKNNPGTFSPLYRYFFISTSTHFYTTNFSLYKNGDGNVQFEGEMGFVNTNGDENETFEKIKDVHSFINFTQNYPNSRYLYKIPNEELVIPNYIEFKKNSKEILLKNWGLIGFYYVSKNKYGSNGYGHLLLEFNDGIKYLFSGNWQNYQLYGKGIIHEKGKSWDVNDEFIYVGELKNSNFDGYGEYKNIGKVGYLGGMFKDGVLAQGKGTIVNVNFKAIFENANYGIYEGEVGTSVKYGENNPNGFGRLKSDKGEWYEGIFDGPIDRLGKFKYFILPDIHGEGNFNVWHRVGTHIFTTYDWLGDVKIQFKMQYDQKGNKIDQTILVDNTKSSNSNYNENNSSPSSVCYDESSIQPSKECGTWNDQQCYEETGGIKDPIYSVKCNNGQKKYFYYQTKDGVIGRGQTYCESVYMAPDYSLSPDRVKALKMLCKCDN